jgi:hypothetical protein
MTHLIVFVHGLHGSSSDFLRFETKLNQKFGQSVVFLKSKANEPMLSTHHGIDIGGIRLKDEIISLVERKPQIKCIRFVCVFVHCSFVYFFYFILFMCFPFFRYYF